jgi:peptide/nickel transport system permease protein
VIFIVLLASSTAGLSPWLAENGWIEGRTLFLGSARSAMEDGINFWNFTLPVLTIALYGMGYIARMTRASMAEVMTAQYIRTARLKGVSFGNIVLKHALRNALIAPFTVIMLQFPWLLTGVVIVETLFNYNGFGWTLVQAASNNDIELLLACSIVAVFVVLVTQLISDIGYVFLNPRIRIA